MMYGQRAGYLDADGQLWLLGRGSDVIRTGSETVHACIGGGTVSAVAVVGLPHAHLGEQVRMSCLSCSMLSHNDRLMVMWRYS
jgi:acyl-CoA synthetase (AMP-forming)/AMP-acid ligase II